MCCLAEERGLALPQLAVPDCVDSPMGDLILTEEWKGAALNAWDGIGEVRKKIESFAKVIQGPKEAFTHLLQRLTSAVNRMISGSEARKIIIETLAFENADSQWKRIIGPLKQWNTQINIPPILEPNHKLTYDSGKNIKRKVTYSDILPEDWSYNLAPAAFYVDSQPSTPSPVLPGPYLATSTVRPLENSGFSVSPLFALISSPSCNAWIFEAHLDSLLEHGGNENR
ncbi:Gag-like protein [Cricetulus griseus]|nr:Gag-like protein [Cricetulus griseus]